MKPVEKINIQAGGLLISDEKLKHFLTRLFMRQIEHLLQLNHFLQKLIWYVWHVGFHVYYRVLIIKKNLHGPREVKITFQINQMEFIWLPRVPKDSFSNSKTLYLLLVPNLYRYTCAPKWHSSVNPTFNLKSNNLKPYFLY